MVFPTRYKAKIPNWLSYPVGAELISSELSELPQAQRFEVSFRNYYMGMEDRGARFEVVTVSYDPSRIFGSDWQIAVTPVPRELKHIVKETLQADFFPRIREWLTTRADLNEGDSCGVIFDEKHEPMWQWRQGLPRPQRLRP